MKIKTDKDQSFVEFLCGQMEDVPELRAKRMFGGYGIYAGTVFFGIVHQGRLYFKTSADTRPRYETHGMTCFQPNAKQKLGNYFQVPVEIIEDQEVLLDWASEAIRFAEPK